ncbi:adenylate/guanylate cyclase with Chase sensor [Candidatus Vecturithrix granuli]|uniref:Adenylate/guanylate cyclase with Chase sensor n=1 Tax=Vecturithrix granuli TaxID=1499967 RepID=A0A081C4S7_VECG1|nr:adenylate/guanylate cyclase with Chase sensor [Candidatus Vecturithrix granuli]
MLFKRLRINQKLLRGTAIGLFSALFALLLWAAGWLEVWEAKTWDWRVSLFAKPGKATGDIRLILLDQKSLDWAAEELGIPWPWPRELYAHLVNYCRRSQVNALAFDVLFTEFSQYGVEDDAALGTAIAEFPHFAAPLFLGTSSGVTQWPADFPTPPLFINGLEQWLTRANMQDMEFPHAVLPIPEMAKNAGLLCNVQHTPDADGVYRRIKIFNLFDQNIFPSLGLGVYLAFHPQTRLQIQAGTLFVGEHQIPIDRNGNAILHYRGPGGTHSFYPAAEILLAESRILAGEPPTDRDRVIFNDLKEKYVFFGFSAPGLKDLRPAPVGGVYSGVEINATLLDNLLSDDFMTSLPTWPTIIIVLGFSLFCALLITFYSSPLQNAGIGAIILILPVFCSLGLYRLNMWLPLVVQELALTLTIVFSLVNNYMTEGRQKRFIKDAFKQYLSPAVIEELLQHPEHLKLGGERRVLSIFFSDIQGFTSISEKLNPEELTTLLNEYLSAMTDIIHEEGGTIDKYEGDAIIAFWNAPLNVPDHAIRVVRAALRCQSKLTEMRPAIYERIGKDLYMRVGINTGPAVVGNMGSRSRFDYTMLGDAVNLASRLEGVNKQFGTYTMISQMTKDQLDETFAVRELARVAVVGRKEPVAVYEPMSWETYQSRKQIFIPFREGLKFFYQGDFAAALEAFSSIHTLDPAAAAYVEKCRDCLVHPPAEWHGIWVMTSK